MGTDCGEVAKWRATLKHWRSAVIEPQKLNYEQKYNREQKAE